MHPRIKPLLAVATLVLFAASVRAFAETPADPTAPVASASQAATPAASAKASPSASQYGPVSMALTFNPTLSNAITSNSFWLMGGGAQFHVRVHHGFGALADVSTVVNKNVRSTGVGLGLLTTTFGLRYTWFPGRARYAVYAQGLGGVARGFGGVFPAPSGSTPSANGSAMQFGGGLDWALCPSVSLRAAEVDWVRTDLPNSTTNVQNNIRFSTGVVFHF